MDRLKFKAWFSLARCFYAVASAPSRLRHDFPLQLQAVSLYAGDSNMIGKVCDSHEITAEGYVLDWQKRTLGGKCAYNRPHIDQR
eukprot:SAG31_NODE_3695_length_3980_cov_6.104870_3_plen_85_part_00